MSIEHLFETTIDHARLKTLEPVKQAIKSLDLPPLRFRKLNGILNALTMQIEDGGDFAEVNERLIDALRLAVIAQVGEEPAIVVLEALARFEQAEALRSRSNKSHRKRKKKRHEKTKEKQ